MRRDIKADLISIFEAGLMAARPDIALLEHVGLENGKLVVDGVVHDPGSGKIRVVGAGKAAAPLAGAIASLLEGRIEEGVIVVKYGHGLSVPGFEVMEAAHPVPDANGRRAAEKILETARKSAPGDLLIVLLTGGASALLPLPAQGITLEDLQRTTSLLLASGASIDEINAIRKHLSAIGGGQLARAANGARLLSFIVSDVIGDDLGAIASGPTYPDSATFGDCLGLINKYGLGSQLPAAVLDRLERGAAGRLPETPKPGDRLFEKVENVIVASNGMAIAACAARARDLGYETMTLDEPMRGEARHMADRLLDMASGRLSGMSPGKGLCLLAGGETTVTLRGAGKGGRNQEMALRAAVLLEGRDGIGALFAGTDGSDGPTDANGGFAFADTTAKIGGRQRAQQYLDANDSYNALDKAGELFKTGPTRTNVMDLAIILAAEPLKS